MPVEIKIKFFDLTDTTFTVMNDTNNQLFSFHFDKQPTELVFDPNNEIVLKISNTVLVSVDENENIPSEFILEQNYPNPFNPNTIIRYQLPETGFVTLKVFDVLGNEIARLVNEEKTAGSYEIEFNSHSDESQNLPAGRQGLSSGIYFYQLKVENKFIETKKLVLMK